MTARIILPLPNAEVSRGRLVFRIDEYCSEYVSLRIRRACCAKHAALALRPYGRAQFTAGNGLLTLTWLEDRPVPARLSRLLLRALLDVARRPLTPREVRSALGISNAERLRWTRDGRLLRSANVVSSSGRRSIPTYSAVHIHELSRNPEVLALWRAADEPYEKVCHAG